MNNKLICALSAILGMVTSGYATDQAQIADWNRKLHDANPQVRIAAAEVIGGNSPQTSGNDILPLLATALGDSEPKVRYYAATTLQAIAQYTQPKTVPLEPGATDIRSSQQVQAALLIAIDDPEPKTRQAALAAYLLSFPVQADLQNKLADRFDGEQKDPLIQLTIMGALSIDGTPSAKADTLLHRLVSSPKTSWNVAQAVAVSNTPPESILPQLVDQISTATEPNKRTILAGAISKYGSKAKPYLSQLNAVRDKEADPATKQLIQTNIQTINSAR